jgi:hypothetical protein
LARLQPQGALRQDETTHGLAFFFQKLAFITAAPQKPIENMTPVCATVGKLRLCEGSDLKWRRLHRDDILSV